jgi:hypothetical protein
MLRFEHLHPRADDLGFIPEFFNPHDPRPAREQLDTAYAHGGGWHPLSGWTFDYKTSQNQVPRRPLSFLPSPTPAFVTNTSTYIPMPGSAYVEVARG